MIEKTWTTKAGLPASVVMTRMGHRCGYVGVPDTHPLYGIAYSTSTPALHETQEFELAPEDVFEVHGGLTYSNDGTHVPLESGPWYFGYDCDHFGDENLSLEFCIEQCESLAKQLAEYNYAVS